MEERADIENSSNWNHFPEISVKQNTGLTFWEQLFII